MSEELRHKHFGDTFSDYIVQVANELPVDAVGIWQIVPAGRHGFDFEGDALTDFVRRCIAELLSRGAVPVIGGGGTPYHWIAQKQYGSNPDDVIENVVREWLANGAKDEDPGGLWFALREDAWFPPD
jgi:hypothetical protein